MPELINNSMESGAGIGLRKNHFDELLDNFPSQIDFMEVGPENWIGVGGRLGKRFRQIVEKTSLVCHGLSLNLGGQAPLDLDFLKQVKQFVSEFNVWCYSDHLSYCADEGHLHDLFPIPFTEEGVRHVVQRIKQVQDIMEERIAIENVSYYAIPGKEMEEIDFLNAVLEEADCLLLLDINNIYVNTINHGYNGGEFLDKIHGNRIVYAHLAGHYRKEETLCIDTHGDDVIDPVWDLLELAYNKFGVFPTLIERDNNIPPLDEMLSEVDKIHLCQIKYTPTLCRKL